MQDERAVEYIEDIYQDTERVPRRIWATTWSELFESFGGPPSLAVEMLGEIQRDLGHHTTEISSAHLACNLDYSHSRNRKPPRPT